MTDARRGPPLGALGRRVALYGGSFDPVHLGHLHVARAAQAAFRLEHVIFVPAARSPHKLDTSTAPAADRVRMLELALDGQPSWSVWTVELERAGPSFTVDTLRCARERLELGAEAELFFVLGWDNLNGLERWREVEELLSLARPIVVWRGVEDTRALEHLRRTLGPELFGRLESGLVRIPPSAVSSTAIRAALARGELPLDALPGAVLEYIRARDIYRA